ncbi:MAG: hypothetical protein EON92_19195 [Burkholderiales bacterium]|nr:MAG: hypothetical protein EON92_19195 [Burkholderiales bacterium]
MSHLNTECRALVAKGMTPQGVVFLAKALKLPAVLVAAFPTMPTHTRDNVMRGETQLFEDGYGDWNFTSAFAQAG